MTPASLSPSMQSHSCSEHGRRAPVPLWAGTLSLVVGYFFPALLPMGHQLSVLLSFGRLFAQQKKSAGDWLGPEQHPATTSVCLWEPSEIRKP